MSSNINYAAIDADYPTAGQDNNTQGFRDNFSSIKTALEVAKSEINKLQTNSVLVATLDDANANVTNDLLGSTIKNGVYSNFYGVVHTEASPIISQGDIDLQDGPLQIFTLSGNSSLLFTNWPAESKYAVVRVHLSSMIESPAVSRTLTLSTANGGAIRYESTFSNPIILNGNGKHKVIEAWSYNHGATVYIKYIGEFG